MRDRESNHVHVDMIKCRHITFLPVVYEQGKARGGPDIVLQRYNLQGSLFSCDIKVYSTLEFILMTFLSLALQTKYI